MVSGGRRRSSLVRPSTPSGRASAGLLLVAAACGGGLGDDASIDPANANALSRILDVENGRRRSGELPEPSLGSAAPFIVVSSTAAVVRGRLFQVAVDFSPGVEGDPARRVFFAVEGAAEFFVLDAPDPLRFDVGVPSDVEEGSFSFNLRVDDAAGRVSQVVSRSIDVIPPIVQREDGFFCTTGNEQSCGGRGLQFCIERESRACFYVVEGEVVSCACPEGGPTTACIDRIVSLCSS